VIERSRSLAEGYGLMHTDPFAKVMGLTGAADAPVAWGVAALATLLAPPIGLPLLALLHVIDEEEMAAVTFPQPAGLCWEQVETLLLPLVSSPALVGLSIADYVPDKDPGGVHARGLTDLVTRLMS
jgi:arginase